MKYIGPFGTKSMTSNYQVVMEELSQMEEDEPDDEVFLPIPSSDLFYAKSAVDEVLSYYEMSSSAVIDGIILHEAKLIGPDLIYDLKQAFIGLEQKALGATIGGAKPSGSGAAGDVIDRDGDGYIYDGTPEETRVPYKRRDGKPVGGGAASGMEARRRQFVRGEANRQGVQLNRGPNRSEQERRFRTEARARFDRIALEGQGFIPADRIVDGDKRNFENRMGDVNAGRTDDEGRSGFATPPPPDTSFQDNEDRRNERLRPPDTSFEDAESARQEGMRPTPRTSGRTPDSRGRGDSTVAESRRQANIPRANGTEAERRRQEGMRPTPRTSGRTPDSRGRGDSTVAESRRQANIPRANGTEAERRRQERMR